ncbi:MAG: signal peptidase II [Frankia sp.]|nr:signal peptidase II [Frankia sp.]
MQAARGAPLTRSAPRERRRSAWHTAVLTETAAIVAVLDAATKTIAVRGLGERGVEILGGAVLFRETRNPGAAFGLAGGATVVFSLVALGVVVAIARSARRLRSRAWAVTLGLLLGGAVGNLADRVCRAPGPLRGRVIDFVDLRIWPVFNLADSALTIGALLAFVLTLRGIELDGSRSRGGGATTDGDTGP